MSPDDFPPLGEIVIPDDARELDRDVVAYHRELRASRRRARYDVLLGRTRWGRRLRASPPAVRRRMATVVIVTAVLVSLLAGALAAIVPSFVRSTGNSPARPLANPAKPVGQAGGLLPETTLTPVTGNDRSPQPARDLRPAAIVLVPRACGCASAVRGVLAEAQLHTLIPAVVAAGSAPDPELAGLTDSSAGAAAVGYLDPAGVLDTTYKTGNKPALLAVDANGVVTTVLTSLGSDPVTGTAVRAALEELARTG